MPLTVAIPLLTAAALAGAGHHLKPRVDNAVAAAAAAAVTVICTLLIFRSAEGSIHYWFGGWQPRHGIAIGISFTVDPLGAALAALVGVLMTAALVFSWDYFETVPQHFHVLMLVFLGAMVGFALSSDLFNLFVFFELMSVSAFALTAYRIEEPSVLQGGINFAVTNSIAAFMILTGIALLYARTGALNLAQIGQVLAREEPDGLVVVAFVLVVCGFLVKAGAVPFHFWLSDAYAVAPAPVGVLFAGVMSDLALHVVARIYWDVFSGPLGGDHAGAVRGVLVGMGIATALLGALMAFLQASLKRMLAFVVVSHVGLFLIGIALLSAEGLAGATVYVVADGLVKGALFLTAGRIAYQLGDANELRIAGRGRRLPGAGIVLVAGGLALAAIPPLGTFLSMALLSQSAAAAGYWWLRPVLTVATLVTGAAVLRAAGRIFLGLGERDEALLEQPAEEEGEEEGEEGARPGALLRLPAPVLLAVGLAIAFAPNVADRATRYADHFQDRAAVARETLHDAAPRPAATPRFEPSAGSYAYGAASTVGALGLAFVFLYRRRLPTVVRRPAGRVGAPLLVGLRNVHDGVTGDYVTWVVVGTAAVGGALALLVH